MTIVDASLNIISVTPSGSLSTPVNIELIVIGSVTDCDNVGLPNEYCHDFPLRLQPFVRVIKGSQIEEIPAQWKVGQTVYESIAEFVLDGCHGDYILEIESEKKYEDSKGDKSKITDSETVTVAKNNAIPTIANVEPAEGFILSDDGPVFKQLFQGEAADNCGLAKVEVSVDGGAYNPANPVTSDWTQWNADVEFYGKDTHTVDICAIDIYENQSSVFHRTVIVEETGDPIIVVTSHLVIETNPLTWPGSEFTVTLGGTAEDASSTISKVEYSVNNDENWNHPVNYTKDVKLTDWNFDLSIPSTGLFQVTIHAVDSSGNDAEVELLFDVVRQYVLEDFSFDSYLYALIDFASYRLREKDSSAPITRELIQQNYYQPFDELISDDNIVNSTISTSQVRIAIEVLRGFLGNQQEYNDYCQEAYFTILESLGTSYTQLRLIREDEDAKPGYAEFLGVEPDDIAEIFRLPYHADNKVKTVDEKFLQDYFGLKSTLTKNIDELPANWGITDTILYQRRVDKLATRWQEIDKDGIQYQETAIPLIEPDYLTDNDFINQDSYVYGIYKVRKKDLIDLYNEIEADRENNFEPKPPDPDDLDLLTGFDFIIDKYISADLDIDWLHVMYTLGIDNRDDQDNRIVPRDEFYGYLSKFKITLEMLITLKRIRDLAVLKVVLVEEWQELYNLIVHYVKVNNDNFYSGWIESDKLASIAQDPRVFNLTGQRPEFIKWRASYQIRRAWEKQLKARANQVNALRQVLQTAIEETEEKAFPGLRKTLIGTIKPDDPEKPFDFDVTDELTKRLSISYKYSGNQRLSPIEQAIETVQDIFQSIRNGKINTRNELPISDSLKEWELALFDNNDSSETEPDPSLSYDEFDFDEEWRWMGSYATWRAANYAFAYPENYLLPTLRDRATWTEAFKDLVKRIRRIPRFTPKDAEQLASQYLWVLKQVRKTDEDDISPIEDGNISFQQIFGDATDYDIELTSQLTSEDLIGPEGRAKRSDELLEDDLLRNDLDQEGNRHLKEIYFYVPVLLALTLQKSGQYNAALDWFQTVYAYDLPKTDRKIYAGLRAEKNIEPEYTQSEDWTLGGVDVFLYAGQRPDSFTRFTIMSIVRCFLAYADSEFTRESNESIPNARRLYLAAQELLNDESFVLKGEFKFPSNPVVAVLAEHAANNLDKLRRGLNIAGMERVRTEPGAMEITIENGKISLPTSQVFKPSNYRYSVLIERARQMVGIAQQVESNYFSALEKRDSEAYSLVNAQQGLAIAKLTVESHGLRVEQANNELLVMDDQETKLKDIKSTYNRWLDEGSNEYEEKMLANYDHLFLEKSGLTLADTNLSFANAAATAASATTLNTGIAAVALGLSKLAAVAKGVAQAGINWTEKKLQENTFHANLERQKDNWSLQTLTAQHDLDILKQQRESATKQHDIAKKENNIATTQQTNAQAVVDYLNKKFTNVELYEWMSGILSEVYSYFLQQATVMAQLAANQLSFERQEQVPAFIKNDYWEIDESRQLTNDEGDAVEVRGLTGSARLLQDIYQLDQHAFETNKRKIQLVQNISLATLYPYEFFEFKKTGELPFATPMSLFDQGFPGHYLRLIKSVKVSVIGLIPPTRGIRATLSSLGGVSKVVSGKEVLSETEIYRPSETIAFTSTIKADGLFELQPENEMLRPFEGMGVDASWRLELPKASNPFNFDTLADVIINIEYTALNHFEYRKQVIQNLDQTYQAEKVYSFRNDFPDQWYHLNNYKVDEIPEEISVQLDIDRNHFPPNIDDLQISGIKVYFVKESPLKNQTTIDDVMLGSLIFHPKDSEETKQLNGATSIDGLISTKRNVSGWLTPLEGLGPQGQWQFVFNNQVNFEEWFVSKNIKDILFVISFSAETPPWPE